MDPTPAERHLVAQAKALIERRGGHHSVAAAVLTADGQTFGGVNLYHFSGGPCAEIVALGRMLTDTESAPATIVAVGNGDRGVVSPCGVCRQIMHDRWPQMRVVLDSDGRLVVVGLPQLLPEP